MDDSLMINNQTSDAFSFPKLHSHLLLTFWGKTAEEEEEEEKEEENLLLRLSSMGLEICRMRLYSGIVELTLS